MTPIEKAALKYDAETPPGCQVEPHEYSDEDEGCRVCAFLAGANHPSAPAAVEALRWALRALAYSDSWVAVLEKIKGEIARREGAGGEGDNNG